MIHPHLPILTAHGDEAFLQAFRAVMQTNDPDDILSTLWNEYNRLKIANNSIISLRIWIAHAIDRHLNPDPNIDVIYLTPLQIDWTVILTHPEWNNLIRRITRKASDLLNTYIAEDDTLVFKNDEYKHYSIYRDCFIAPTALGGSRIVEHYKF
jgi:hypothetical protein